MNKHRRIIFMGTPDFAVPSLEALVQGLYNVVAVVTAPDKAVGRHQSTLKPSPVKTYAVSVGLPVLQPERLKDEAFLDCLRSYRADLQVVVAFRMLPEVVWSMPPDGTFNLHASLLPRFRGAAPINWAIIRGEKETGVTTFFLKQEIDTGSIIRQTSTTIRPDDNAQTLHDRLMTLGARLVVATVDDIEAGTVVAHEQDETLALCPAPKIFKETCRIDWTQSPDDVYNFVRGLAPYPGAWTAMNAGGKETTVKILLARLTAEGASTLPVGQVSAGKDGAMSVALTDGSLIVEELQEAGHRRMRAADWLRGLRTFPRFF